MRALIVKLKKLAPYAAIAFLMPGGSVMVLLYWFYRRQKEMTGFAVSLNTLL